MKGFASRLLHRRTKGASRNDTLHAAEVDGNMEKGVHVSQATGIEADEPDFVDARDQGIDDHIVGQNFKGNTRIAIVGAGIGGLCAAIAFRLQGFQKVVVYEAAPALGEVGAGIQVAPNLCRVLDHFGILEELRQRSVEISGVKIHRYADSRIIGTLSFDHFPEAFGYTTIVVHRAHLHSALLGKALSVGVHVLPSHKLTNVDFERTTLTFESGATIEADLIVAADGIKSGVRRLMLERRGLSDEKHLIDTGEAAFRFVIPRERMLDDPELKALIDCTTVQRWIGPDAHLVAYPITAHQAYNVVTDHKSTCELQGDWTNTVCKKEMAKRFADYAPIVQNLIGRADPLATLEWKLKISHHLDSWHDGHVALLGDSCHPTLPHLSQGAALAGEDALVLAAALGKIDDVKDIPGVLRAYELVRIPRSNAACDAAFETGNNLHVHDGPEQEKRDAAIDSGSRFEGPCPDGWGDRDVQKMLYQADPLGDLERFWAERVTRQAVDNHSPLAHL